MNCMSHLTLLNLLMTSKIEQRELDSMAHISLQFVCRFSVMSLQKRIPDIGTTTNICYFKSFGISSSNSQELIDIFINLLNNSNLFFFVKPSVLSFMYFGYKWKILYSFTYNQRIYKLFVIYRCIWRIRCYLNFHLFSFIYFAGVSNYIRLMYYSCATGARLLRQFSYHLPINWYWLGGVIWLSQLKKSSQKNKNNKDFYII